MSLTKRARNCQKAKDSEAISSPTKRICIPIDHEAYEGVLFDAEGFRGCLDAMIAGYPELFPSAMGQGYALHDLLPASKKMEGIRFRRIKVKSNGEVFTIAPFDVLPFMTGYAKEVEKPLFLRKFGVPYWALTYVFGRNDMYWYRVENHIGRNSIVGTTLKDPSDLPKDVLADEKHSKENGDKIYIATTVADDCILGASVAPDAGTESLMEAYGPFKEEAQDLSQDYQPETVNTDGWTATQSAWKGLFSNITVILCFLHAFLKIRDRCKHMKPYFQEISKQVWEAYHAPNKVTFMQKIETLKAWTKKTIQAGAGQDAIFKLCEKANEFIRAYEYPSAYRTSNRLDRIMDHQDRYLYSCRYFHGHRLSSEYSVRAWALMHNFQPYCPRSRISSEYLSPVHKLNGFVYHDNWLQNLLVAASRGGFRN